ncbi:MAG: hypothetical protein EB032_03085 [Betaproteobacteria bacterium]|nr:hypothetical protein [Betaproteobacteria bacterium]
MVGHHFVQSGAISAQFDRCGTHLFGRRHAGTGPHCGHIHAIARANGAHRFAHQCTTHVHHALADSSHFCFPKTPRRGGSQPDLLEQDRLSDPQQLKDHTLISYDTEPMAWSEWLPMAGQADMRVAHTLQFEQMYFALQAAAEGLGVVLVPLFLVADDIIAGRLCAPFGLLGARQRRYYANAPLSSQESPVIEGFCEWLLKEGQDTEQSIDQLAQTMGWTISGHAAV